MQIQILKQFQASNPYSAAPATCLAIVGSSGDAEKLILASASCQQIIADFPKAETLLSFLLATKSDVGCQIQDWLLTWFELLLSWSGFVQLEPPRQLPVHSSEADHDWQCRIQLPCFVDDHARLLALLRWSVDCWAWCLNRPSQSHHVASLRERFGSLYRQSPKASFLAMAKYAMLTSSYCDLSSQAGTYWLHVGVGVGSRRISQKVTDATSAWGLQMTKDKWTSKQLLDKASLPVARGCVVTSLAAGLDVSIQLGYPVVLKPVAADRAVGVVTAIRNQEELAAAWDIASHGGAPVLIEKHIRGKDFRFLVVNGTLLAGLERIPGGVVGDGSSNIETLVAKQNALRSGQSVLVEGETSVTLKPICWDDEARVMLSRQGLGEDDVPGRGQYVRLRYSANYSVGGTVRECSGEVHPFNAFLLEKAARLSRLDIVGIDVIAPSISEPLTLNGGVICELNGMPGVLPHMLAEPDRALMAEIADRLLVRGSHVPVVAIHAKDAERFIEQVERVVLPDQPGLTVASRHSLRQSGQLLRQVDASRLAVQRLAIQDPSATAFLLQLDGDDLMAHGLVCSQLDLLILASPDQNSLPEPWRDWLCSCARRVIQLDSLSETQQADAVSQALVTASQILAQGTT